MTTHKQSAPSEPALRVLAVAGSLNRESVTRVVVGEAARQLAALGCAVDLLDLLHEPLPLYNPDTAYDAACFPALKQRVDQADVVILGTPDYHGERQRRAEEFPGPFLARIRLRNSFATYFVACANGGSLTVTDQLRTVARQCYAWTLPYGVSFMGDEEIKDGKVSSEELAQRLEMMTRDIVNYGRLLAAQRRADLASKEPGFMARLR